MDSLLDLLDLSLLKVTHNWTKEASKEFEFLRENLEVFGVTDIIELSTKKTNKITYSITNMNKDDEYSLLTFFHINKGRWGKFWVPDYGNMFTLKETYSINQSYLQCNWNYFDFQGYERIYLWLQDDSWITRKISSIVADESSNSLKLYLSTTIDRVITVNDIDRFSFVYLVRFDQDSLDMTYITDEISETDVNFIELVDEYENG